MSDEPLASNFNGVMGLALPANSVISELVPDGTSDVPDGADLTSNIFGITPASAAPGARYFSLALERPGSDRVPSVLGIGRHPSTLVPDPSKIGYAPIVAASSQGPRWWQPTVEAITLYVDGTPKSVTLTKSSTSPGNKPSAILDSGSPLIIATEDIANAIYGALGIGPAADGNCE